LSRIFIVGFGTTYISEWRKFTGTNEALEEKITKETAAAASGRSAAKDMSVVALIPEFTGLPGDLKVNEFLEAVNLVVRMGSWTEDDKRYAAKLKTKVNLYLPSLRMKVPDHVYVFGSLLLQ
jgi:hypothetical protein